MDRFTEFTRERHYLHNVSPATVSWYTHALKMASLGDAYASRTQGHRIADAGEGTQGNRLQRGYPINAYLHWASGSERKCGAGCQHPRIPQLKEPQKVLPTLSESQVKAIVGWRPGRKFYRRRLHLLALLLLDTGCRISEALGLRVADLDMDNLLVTLDGKGCKQSIVPFSFALRKTLHRYIADLSLKAESLVLATQQGTRVRRMTALRSVKLLCQQLGFAPPGRTLHAFRHTFAVNYLRRGGSVFHLQKVLGHSSLEMTRRYANLVTTDLQAMHERVSLLSRP